MPELPEVETLRMLIVRKSIKSIDILKSKSFVGDRKLVLGKKIIGVRRFAKILVIDLSNGFSLAIHLKMSGQLIYCPDVQHRYTSRHTEVVNNLPYKHTRVIINFTKGDRLFFNDMRIFGWIKVVINNPINKKIQNINDLIKNLGPEPLRDLTQEIFKKILKTSKKPVKLILMDQEKIAGVGNIYANDALFLAGIHPGTPASQIAPVPAGVLYHKLLKLLKSAIKWGGASQNNFRDAYGNKGEVQKHFHVYDKEGKACPNKCGENIKRIKLGGRGTFYCPKCI